MWDTQIGNPPPLPCLLRAKKSLAGFGLIFVHNLSQNHVTRPCSSQLSSKVTTRKLLDFNSKMYFLETGHSSVVDLKVRNAQTFFIVWGFSVLMCVSSAGLLHPFFLFSQVLKSKRRTSQPHMINLIIRFRSLTVHRMASHGASTALAVA